MWYLGANLEKFMAATEFTVHYLRTLQPGPKPKDYYDKKVTDFGIRLSPGGEKTLLLSLPQQPAAHT